MEKGRLCLANFTSVENLVAKLRIKLNITGFYQGSNNICHWLNICLFKTASSLIFTNRNRLSYVKEYYKKMHMIDFFLGEKLL